MEKECQEKYKICVWVFERAVLATRNIPTRAGNVVKKKKTNRYTETRNGYNDTSAAAASSPAAAAAAK